MHRSTCFFSPLSFFSQRVTGKRTFYWTVPGKTIFIPAAPDVHWEPRHVQAPYRLPGGQLAGIGWTLRKETLADENMRGRICKDIFLNSIPLSLPILIGFDVNYLLVDLFYFFNFCLFSCCSMCFPSFFVFSFRFGTFTCQFQRFFVFVFFSLQFYMFSLFLDSFPIILLDFWLIPLLSVLFFFSLQYALFLLHSVLVFGRCHVFFLILRLFLSIFTIFRFFFFQLATCCFHFATFRVFCVHMILHHVGVSFFVAASAIFCRHFLLPRVFFGHLVPYISFCCVFFFVRFSNHFATCFSLFSFGQYHTGY